MSKFKFPNAWLSPVGKAFCKNVVHEIETKLIKEKSLGARIFPENLYIFRALELVHFEDVKVMILGQDPYHGKGQANGLSFSVNKGCKIPPSLKNIFIELKNDLNIPICKHGDLEFWAQQNVLLLNSVLTVEKGIPNSHKVIGWEKLTDKIISVLSERGKMIFVLWGKEAQRKKNLIDPKINSILMAPHPSPLSSYRGFFGCNHFSKINNILIKGGMKPINWNLN